MSTDYIAILPRTRIKITEGGVYRYDDETDERTRLRTLAEIRAVRVDRRLPVASPLFLIIAIAMVYYGLTSSDSYWIKIPVATLGGVLIMAILQDPFSYTLVLEGAGDMSDEEIVIDDNPERLSRVAYIIEQNLTNID